MASSINSSVNYIHSTFHNITLSSDVAQFKSQYIQSCNILKNWLDTLKGRREQLLKAAKLNPESIEDSQVFLNTVEQLIDPNDYQKSLANGKQALEKINNIFIRGKKSQASYSLLDKNTEYIVTLKDPNDPKHIISDLKFIQQYFNEYWRALERVYTIAVAITETSNQYYNTAQKFIILYKEIEPLIQALNLTKPTSNITFYEDAITKVTTVVVNKELTNVFEKEQGIHKILSQLSGTLFETGFILEKNIPENIKIEATGFEKTNKKKAAPDQKTRDIIFTIGGTSAGVSMKNLYRDSLLPPAINRSSGKVPSKYTYTAQGKLESVCKSEIMAFINYYTLGHLKFALDASEKEKQQANLASYYILYSWIIERLVAHMEDIDLISYNGHVFWYYDFLTTAGSGGYLSLLPLEEGKFTPKNFKKAPYINPHFFTQVSNEIKKYVGAQKKGMQSIYDAKEKYRKTFTGKGRYAFMQGFLKSDNTDNIGKEMSQTVETIRGISLTHAIWQHGNITSIK